jgi:hypothetical protein
MSVLNFRLHISINTSSIDKCDKPTFRPSLNTDAAKKMGTKSGAITTASTSYKSIPNHFPFIKHLAVKINKLIYLFYWTIFIDLYKIIHE